MSHAQAQVERRIAGPFVVWAVVGALWVVGVLGIASIGLYVLPCAVIGTAVASSSVGWRGLVALPVAAAIASAAILIPFVASGQHESSGDQGDGIAPPPVHEGQR
ncbi:MAG TPA: hypothetical protein VNU26_01630 [Mycobacteriales bacterium]|nr:hypothetical protein [Mycobacteriales bacterium]